MLGWILDSEGQKIVEEAGVCYPEVGMHQVLFICVGNSSRSQMAEAFFNHLARGRPDLSGVSAGTQPARAVDPNAVAVMAELGIDMSGQSPKLLAREMVESATRVISMGCGVQGSCPAWAQPDEDWDLADPHHQPVEVVRRIRDQIRVRVEALVRELAGDNGDSPPPSLG
jgi:arsenate reductase